MNNCAHTRPGGWTEIPLRSSPLGLGLMLHSRTAGNTRKNHNYSLNAQWVINKTLIHLTNITVYIFTQCRCLHNSAKTNTEIWTSLTVHHVFLSFFIVINQFYNFLTKNHQNAWEVVWIYGAYLNAPYDVGSFREFAALIWKWRRVYETVLTGLCCVASEYRTMWTNTIKIEHFRPFVLSTAKAS